MRPAFDPFDMVAVGPFEDLEMYKQDGLDYSVKASRDAILKLGHKALSHGVSMHRTSN